MSVFSLDWFRSKKKEADPLYDLYVEEQKLKNEILRQKVEKKDKPYRKMTLVNDVLTVVMNDGTIIVKPECSQDDFMLARTAKTEDQLFEVLKDLNLLSEREDWEKSRENIERVYKGFNVVTKLKDFETKDDCIYIKGINRSLPELLVIRIGKVAEKYLDEKGNVDEDALSKDDEYLSLKRFFMWCCLNPRAEVAEKLYDFLEKNKFKFTKQGMFVALRNVVNVAGSDSEIVDFISNAYNKVKGVWKKNPVDYHVYEEKEGYVLVHRTKIDQGYEKYIGNLKDLYVDLPNMRENRFTDDWTKTFDIRIGKTVWMDPKECNWSTQDCAAAGLVM